MVRQAAPGVPRQRVHGRDPRHRGSRLARLAAVALVLPLWACASALPETPGARRSADIEELKARVLELSQQARVSELEIDRLREQVAALEARLGAAAVRPAAPVATPAQPARSSRPPAPPPVARPAVEEDELAEEDLVMVPAAPSAPARTPAAPAPRAAVPASPAPAAQPVPREAQAIYDDAYTLYHQGRFEQAERRFEEFLAASTRSELSDNAQYWIGAARFARGDFRGALVAFRTTVELYPAENKVPDALFKMGQALEELGDPGEAKTVYRDLVQRFPDTAAATLADERLAQLR